MSSNQGMKDTKEKKHTFMAKEKKGILEFFEPSSFQGVPVFFVLGFLIVSLFPFFFLSFFFFQKTFERENETKGKSSKIKNNNVTNS
mmetsp:Transcript_15479/g.17193  ORF Transcript_15479/g.17193 Transcript_15479/m.17193 type:complete len:87 (+) Transcript_15479:374-634(+)